jgi:cytochrome c peroxidase
MSRLVHSLDAFPSESAARRLPLALLASCLLAAMAPRVAIAQSDQNEVPAMPAWAIAAHAQALQVPVTGEALVPEAIPTTIPTDDIIKDPTGQLESFQLGGDTDTSTNAFFQSLGTNGRSCFSCHEPQDGWTITPKDATAPFNSTKGTDPVFNPLDGATCPDDNVKTLGAKRAAYKLLLTRGLIRVFLPMPANPEFSITSVKDPYKCNTNPTYGLISPTTGFVSVYRRPLPASGLFSPASKVPFESTIMWDGREATFTSQAIDATLIHAQATATPTAAQLTEITSFEEGIFTAQSVDKKAGELTAAGAAGGAIALSAQPFIVNDLSVPSPPFDDDVFDLYTPWASISGNTAAERMQESIARGQALFNTLTLNITGVAGLNDVLGQKTITGSCSTCHTTANVGNRSVDGTMEIATDLANDPTINAAGLPLFTITCNSGPFAGTVYQTTDPGRALITGQCADIGKVKVPSLRGLAARAPYFHNGSANTLPEVITHYGHLFGIFFTAQQSKDLTNFLNTL